MQKVSLQAQPRTVLGKKVRALRRGGLVPAVIYGHGFEPLNVQLNYKDFEKAYKQAGQSTIVYVYVDGSNYPTIIHDVAIDPLSDDVIHADFYKVKLDEKIKTNVPLVFVGESTAVKELRGILVKSLNEIEVEALPQDLPHEIEIDLSVLKNFDDQISIQDIKLPKGVEIKAEGEVIIASVQQPLSEEEMKAQLETPASGTAEEVEVIKKEKEEESGEGDEKVEGPAE